MTEGSPLFVEPRLRELVADTLGVDLAEIVPDVSLIDDLAADSLDLVELGIRLEASLGVSLPDDFFDEIRTYAELVEASVRVVQPLLVSARVLRGNRQGFLERTEWLTPYVAESIAEDALHAGRGARLEVAMAPDTSATDLARVQRQFAWLGERGLEVTVRRSGESPPPDGVMRESGARHAAA